MQVCNEFPGNLVKRASAILTALDAAVVVKDLRILVRNHLGGITCLVVLEMGAITL